MRSIHIALAAALCWTGALSASPAGAKDGAEMEMMAGRRRLARSNGRHRLASSDFAQLGLRQGDQQCGAQYGKCPGDLCCSSYGFCGDSVDHCHPLFDCQAQYGTCGWPRVAPQPTTTSTTSARPTSTSTSTTSQPPTTAPTTAPTTTTRPSSTSTSTTPIPTGDLQVTTNGMCGNNTMCIGNPSFGPCCSQFFWCGSSMEFCGAGCKSDFGACLGVPGLPGNPPTNGTTTPGGPTSTPGGSTTTPPPTTTSTTRVTTTSTSTTRVTTTSTSTTPAAPSFTLPAGQRSSTDGKCGNGQNCLGSTFGRCCSQFGYCGDSDQFCPYIVGCQPQFGYCDPQ
ncbi:hypothetical protein C8A00DRAFT_37608 [Chaetomidium leptoderma]|uniref:Chitin-binding type-1 domain-containing protein n=1 Tax=Chaetomidium leptoderma TaxID=669021 RepID=A0AAN6VGK8_9PEZI|nr:hypothetical protein C8A00DRAFT_37608 [Chaetomidium leptoderma]